jgi:hypothetical protein
VWIYVDAGYLSAAPRQLEAVVARVAADVERGPAIEPRGKVRSKPLPLIVWKIAEPVVGCGLSAIGKVQIVEPWSQVGDLLSVGMPAPVYLFPK